MAIGVLITIVSIAYILAFLQIYACCHFKSIQPLLIVQKRYPKLVLIEAYVVIFYLFICVPFWENGNYDVTHLGLSMSAFSIFKAITSNCLVIPVIHFIPIIEITRLWLISYDLHYLQRSINEQWKTQIDHSFAEKDWYLKNRNTFGNLKYVMTRTLIYYSCLAVFLTTMNLIDHFSYAGNFAGILNGVFFLFDIIFVFYIYFKCRKYGALNDNLLFHYEFKVTTIIWAFCFFLFVVAQIFQYSGLQLVSRSIVTCAAFLTYTAPSLLSTLWIPRKIQFIGLWDDVLIDNSANSNEVMMTVINGQQNNKQQEQETTVEDRLKETLKNEEKFESFIQWMYRCFSAESVLCFIEIVQFKEYVMDFIENNNMNKTTEEYTIYINLLPETMPKSSIIYTEKDKDIQNNEDISIMKTMAHLLYDKYIKYDAEFEVNIAANLRRKYIRFDGQNWDKDIGELVNVFDPIIHEMFLFMRNSFVRYEKM